MVRNQESVVSRKAEENGERRIRELGEKDGDYGTRGGVCKFEKLITYLWELF